MRDELGEKIMKKSPALRPKMYSYLMIDGFFNIKAMFAKDCQIKPEKIPRL